MADQFILAGGYTTTPLNGVPSFAPNIDAPIDEPITLIRKHVDDVNLNVDTPVVVPFGGGVVNAHIVILKAIGGPVVARVTSSAGALKEVPFDTYLILMSMGRPITAIDLTRTPATPTDVRVFLGEKA